MKMLPRDMQLANEHSFSRKHIDGYILDTLQTKEIQKAISYGVDLLEEWRKQEFYASKQRRVDQLDDLDLYELVTKIMQGIAYVQKPVEEEELREALEKAKKMLSPENEIDKILAMLQPPAKQYRERFLIPKGDQFQIVNSFAISYLEVDGKGAIAHLSDTSSMNIPESLNELENELDPKMFFRCSRQYLINIEDIVKIESTWNAKLILKLRRFPDVEFEVSRDRVKELKEKLNQ